MKRFKNIILVGIPGPPPFMKRVDDPSPLFIKLLACMLIGFCIILIIKVIMDIIKDK